MSRMRTSFSKIDYPAILDEAWQQHLAPRESNAPTVISLFAGCGGSSLGYSMAGYRELLAVEWNDNAVATFKLNFPDVPVYHGDIHKLTVEQCLEMAGLEPGKLDLLDGSPPCQGFSTAGKRKMKDKRNQLYMQFVRLLRGLRPKVFVMENVSGLIKGKMKLIFADIMKELKASGYKVRCKLFNAMYFNVPQSRQRLIWIGVREGLAEQVSFPKAESRPITVREALPHVKRITWDPRGQFTPGDYSPNDTLGVITKSSAHQWAVEPTHPTEKRKFSITELKQVGAFPDQFLMVGSYSERWVLVGNSVPPLFMQAIADHIKRKILN